jgi:signal transduction histidine kinase
MEALIPDLLAYSRLGRDEIRLQPVSLEAVVQGAVAELEDEVRSRHAELKVEEPLPTVLAHRATLGQMVRNLLGNALKFTAPGVAPRVRVWAESTPGWVRLWVEDNGIGIAPAHRERIWRVFERLHGDEAYPGTGIGLAIVQRGAERMGGRAGLESEVGAGSRFVVELQSPPEA